MKNKLSVLIPVFNILLIVGLFYLLKRGLNPAIFFTGVIVVFGVQIGYNLYRVRNMAKADKEADVFAFEKQSKNISTAIGVIVTAFVVLALGLVIIFYYAVNKNDQETLLRLNNFLMTYQDAKFYVIGLILFLLGMKIYITIKGSKAAMPEIEKLPPKERDFRKAVLKVEIRRAIVLPIVVVVIVVVFILMRRMNGMP
jgi:hypothetical protein